MACDLVGCLDCASTAPAEPGFSGPLLFLPPWLASNVQPSEKQGLCPVLSCPVLWPLSHSVFTVLYLVSYDDSYLLWVLSSPVTTALSCDLKPVSDYCPTLWPLCCDHCLVTNVLYSLLSPVMAVHSCEHWPVLWPLSCPVNINHHPGLWSGSYSVTTVLFVTTILCWDHCPVQWSLFSEYT